MSLMPGLVKEITPYFDIPNGSNINDAAPFELQESCWFCNLTGFGQFNVKSMQSDFVENALFRALTRFNSAYSLHWTSGPISLPLSEGIPCKTGYILSTFVRKKRVKWSHLQPTGIRL
jgi:hypothetical protein